MAQAAQGRERGPTLPCTQTPIGQGPPGLGVRGRRGKQAAEGQGLARAWRLSRACASPAEPITPLWPRHRHTFLSEAVWLQLWVTRPRSGLPSARVSDLRRTL